MSTENENDKNKPEDAIENSSEATNLNQSEDNTVENPSDSEVSNSETSDSSSNEDSDVSTAQSTDDGDSESNSNVVENNNSMLEEKANEETLNEENTQVVSEGSQETPEASTTPEETVTSSTVEETPEVDETNKEVSATMKFLQEQAEEKTPTTEEQPEPEVAEVESSTSTPEEELKTEENEIELPDMSYVGTDATEEKEEEEEEIDYSTLSKTELLEASKKILEEEKDVRKADKKVIQIREFIDKINREERETAKAAFLAEQEQKGEDEEKLTIIDFHYSSSPEIDEFFGIFKQIKNNKKEHFESLTKEREHNLKAKQTIINQLKDLMENADKSVEVGTIKELNEKWKSIGHVPKADADNLYQTYSALLDRFYQAKSIEYDLKALDRKKNLEVKLELCEKAEALAEMENINEAVSKLNQLHEDYKSTGPIPKEQQEDVWQRFKAASDKLYDKKREMAEEFKKQLEENMKVKQELCLAVEPFINFDSDRIKEWNEKTKELLNIQKEWEKIGPLPREVAKDINKQFWGNFKAFFANKSAFFEKLEATRGENLKLKEALVTKAEELKESKDWNATTDALKKLQADWKEIGPVPEAHRDEVYAKFKAACDYFFERKRNRKSLQDQEFIENLEKKMEVIAKIEKLAEEKDADLTKFDALKEEYNAVGFVPRKDINTILEKVVVVIDKYFDAIEVEDAEKKKLTAKSDILKNMPNASKKLSKQEQGIKNKISNIEKDISLWQNNIQFFANSKTADKLKEDFNNKIEKAQNEIQGLKEQLKIIRNINK